MKSRLHKTNAARILDELGLPYELASYEVDEENRTVRVLRMWSHYGEN